MTQHTLRAGELELSVDAARGGSIMAFRERGFDLMRPWDGCSDDPRAYASFPLVPFSGRVDHGRFRFDGRSYTLAPNFPPEPHAIHGDGWTSPWTVVTVGRRPAPSSSWSTTAPATCCATGPPRSSGSIPTGSRSR